MRIPTLDPTETVTRARTAGYDLVQRELDTGQLVWTFRREDDSPQPCFLTRREALNFMADRLYSIALSD